MGTIFHCTCSHRARGSHRHPLLPNLPFLFFCFGLPQPLKLNVCCFPLCVFMPYSSGSWESVGYVFSVQRDPWCCWLIELPGMRSACVLPVSTILSALPTVFQSLHSIRQPQVHAVPRGASEEAEQRNVLYSVVCKWINAFKTDCNKRLGITLYFAGVTGSMTGLTVVNIVMHVREQMVCHHKTWVRKLQLFLQIIYLWYEKTENMKKDLV